MNYKFKLSRRIARIRVALPITTIFLGVACAGDPSGLGPTGVEGRGTVRISPDSVSVAANQTVQFDASTDASAGTATLSRGGKGRGHYKSTIVSLTLTPQSTTLDTGASNRFSATATLSDGSLVLPSLRWTATGGTIDSTGLYTAGPVPGTYSAIATSSNGLADTATVTVTASAPLVIQLTLSPATTTLPEGASKQFSALGKASDGSTVGVSPAFTATGGTVTAAGVYTAGKAPGSFRVIATDQVTSLADTAAVTVTTPTTTLQSVILTPSTVSLTAGQTKQFTATGLMSDSSTGSVTVTWSAAGGTISSAGLYTAGSTAGNYRVIGTDTASGLADSSMVTITAPSPTLQAVVLTPASVTLQSEGTQQFAVSGRMSDGSTTTVNVTYSATGGTITSSGNYAAGSVAGSYRVIATQNGGTLADTSTVSVTTPPTTPPPSSSCLRTVNVSTMASLTTALNAALPGDCILMAAGTYSVSSTLFITRGGTAANPITIQGAGTASTIIDLNTSSGNPEGYAEMTGSYIHLRKIRMTDAGGVVLRLRGVTGVVVDSMEFDHSNQELMFLVGGSHHNIVKNSWFHDSGLVNPQYGEAIYISNSGTQPGTSYDFTNVYNEIRHNHFGPNVPGDAVDLKVGADHTSIVGNFSDGTGAWSGGPAAGNGAHFTPASSYNVIDSNTIKYGKPAGIGTCDDNAYPQVGNVITNNHVDLQNILGVPAGSSSLYGFNFSCGTNTPTANTFKCSNTTINGPNSNMACVP